jgi:hypothetical protein
MTNNAIEIASHELFHKKFFRSEKKQSMLHPLIGKIKDFL